MRNVPEKAGKKFKTHILHSTIFFPKNHAVYEKTWENMVEPDRPQMSI
jgi:hypothetical protein